MPNEFIHIDNHYRTMSIGSGRRSADTTISATGLHEMPFQYRFRHSAQQALIK